MLYNDTATLTGVAAVATGDTFTCAVLAVSGGVRCWGRGASGELGNGVMSYARTPVPPDFSSANTTTMSSLETKRCAVSGAAAELWCFGDFNPGNTVDYSVYQPKLVATGVVAVSVGLQHFCFTNGSAQLFCAGFNDFLQMGMSSPVTMDPMPSTVTGVVLVACGYFHTCVVLQASNDVKCLGDNRYSQLGESASTVSRGAADGPVVVTNVTAISAGNHFTCAILAVNSSVVCWGTNDNYQLGRGNLAWPPGYQPYPVNVTDPGVVAISLSLGGAHACLVTAAQQVLCWGANGWGALGIGSSATVYSPMPALVSSIALVSCGQFHTCAVNTSGAVYCWGSNSKFQLGSGSAATTAPTLSQFASDVALVDAGGLHTCITFATNGSMTCFGSNVYVSCWCAACSRCVWFARYRFPRVAVSQERRDWYREPVRPVVPSARRLVPAGPSSLRIAHKHVHPISHAVYQRDKIHLRHSHRHANTHVFAYYIQEFVKHGNVHNNLNCNGLSFSIAVAVAHWKCHSDSEQHAHTIRITVRNVHAHTLTNAFTHSVCYIERDCHTL